MRADRLLFVTGTDTGVGKTYVGAALLAHWTKAGRDVVGLKPVETGCGGAIAPTEDGVILAAASGQSSPRAALTRLAMPVAPPVAGDAEGAVLSLESWYDAIDRLSDQHERVLIEGAGGLLSPLTWRASLRDLISTTGGRALVVASDRLGSINHLLLTLEALGRATVGAVFSAPPSPDPSTGSNAGTVQRLVPELRVAVLARGQTAEAAVIREIAGWIDA